MRFSIASATLALLSGTAAAASSWGFSDGQVQVTSKAADSTGSTYSFSTKERAKEPVTLGHSDKFKVSLTTKDGSSAKRPHQAFLIIKESTGLEAPFALSVKGSGKGSVEITQKDLPVQLLFSEEPLEASIVLGSFGSSQGSITPAFSISVQPDANGPAPAYEAPLRYGKLDEIHHVFKGEPKNPPKIVSIVFSVAVLATIPALLIGWTLLGGNLSHVQKALSTAPIAHITFFGSIVAMEGVFFLYYSGLRLFATLPIIGAVGSVAFLSGAKALGEVQGRRLAGER